MLLLQLFYIYLPLCVGLFMAEAAQSDDTKTLLAHILKSVSQLTEKMEDQDKHIEEIQQQINALQIIVKLQEHKQADLMGVMIKEKEIQSEKIALLEKDYKRQAEMVNEDLIVNNLGNKLYPAFPEENKVALYVQKTGGHQSNLGQVSFETVVTQQGGLWNAVVSNFILPVKGVYFFYLGIRADVSTHTEVWIRQDLTNLQQAVAYGNTNYTTASGATTVELEENTQMSAFLERGTLYGGSTGQTHFTGFMLYPM